MRILLSLAFIIIAVAVIISLFLFTVADRTIILNSPQKFEYGDLTRTYRLHVPTNKVNKIVVSLHGFNSSGRTIAYYTGIHNVVDDNTMVVYPDATKPVKEGIKTGWNSGFCCGSGYVQEIDDTGFIMALVADLQAEYNSEAKVYATGFSNGAFMAQRLAVDHPDKIAAVAAISGSIGTRASQLEPKLPTPILLTHGDEDKIVPFSGGLGSNDPNFVWLSFADTVSAWQNINGSHTTTEVVVHKGNGHKWDGWRILDVWKTQPEESVRIVNFFNSL
ncbi:MAG: polyhydroxybutyrate depolymerase [Candidatus Saccharimonadales bacterium]|jgi:polyhydroxybutyrate depolymerase